MRDLYVAGVYMSFVAMTFLAPFVGALGYLWVDTFYPQYISSLVAMISPSMVMGVLAVGAFMVGDRKALPKLNAHTVVHLMFALWVSITLLWAVAPPEAWEKWNWAFKTVLVTAFLPYVIRTRVQIEAFLQVFMASAMIYMMPLGLKTLIGGSGYGRSLGIIDNNVGLTESSTLAAVSIAMIPVLLYLREHSVLIPKSKLRDLGYLGLVVVCIASAMGTYARTALIGFVVVAIFMWIQTKRKALFGAIVAVLVLVFSTITAASWGDRVETTADFQSDDSALARILVWKWTLGWIVDNPLGGGFNAYMIDHIVLPADGGGAPLDVYGKAYHNMYIEVLGEQGIPGILMFGSLLSMSLLSMLKLRKQTKNMPHMLWCYDLAGAFLSMLLTLMACGNFVGIGFQSPIWYALTLPMCLMGYVQRVQKMEQDSPVETAQVMRNRIGGIVPIRVQQPKLAR